MLRRMIEQSTQVYPPAERSTDRGAAAREQLIAHATRIFAAKGFAAATTREICDAAGANIAAIHYYFGDKEGLYRAALVQPLTEFTEAFGRFDDPALSFEQAMRMFLSPFLLTCRDSGEDKDAQVMKLHLREIIEPSAVFRDITQQTIVPAHNALAAVLARHCGVEPDADIHQLAFAIAAMANDYCISRSLMPQLAPQVLERPGAPELILERLIGYSVALLNHEIERRRATTRRA